MNAFVLMDILRAAARKHRSMIGLARDANVSRETMYRAINLISDPSLSTILKLSDALGYELKLEKRKDLEAKQAG